MPVGEKSQEDKILSSLYTELQSCFNEYDQWPNELAEQKVLGPFFGQYFLENSEGHKLFQLAFGHDDPGCIPLPKGATYDIIMGNNASYVHPREEDSAILFLKTKIDEVMKTIRDHELDNGSVPFGYYDVKPMKHTKGSLKGQMGLAASRPMMGPSVLGAYHGMALTQGDIERWIPYTQRQQHNLYQWEVSVAKKGILSEKEVSLDPTLANRLNIPMTPFMLMNDCRVNPSPDQPMLTKMDADNQNISVASITIDNKWSVLLLVLIKDVEEGDELRGDYGNHYWSVFLNSTYDARIFHIIRDHLAANKDSKSAPFVYQPLTSLFTSLLDTYHTPIVFQPSGRAIFIGESNLSEDECDTSTNDDDYIPEDEIEPKRLKLVKSTSYSRSDSELSPLSDQSYASPSPALKKRPTKLPIPHMPIHFSTSSDEDFTEVDETSKATTIPTIASPTTTPKKYIRKKNKSGKREKRIEKERGSIKAVIDSPKVPSPVDIKSNHSNQSTEESLIGSIDNSGSEDEPIGSTDEILNYTDSHESSINNDIFDNVVRHGINTVMDDSINDPNNNECTYRVKGDNVLHPYHTKSNLTQRMRSPSSIVEPVTIIADIDTNDTYPITINDDTSLTASPSIRRDSIKGRQEMRNRYTVFSNSVDTVIVISDSE